jgi:hypothetical protein
LTHESFASACFKAEFSYHGLPEPKVVTPDTVTAGDTLYPPVENWATICAAVPIVPSGVRFVVKF